MQKRSAKFFVLTAAAIVHLLVSALAVVPGHLSVDEGTYHMMVRDRAAGHGFEIVNGYRETPSPELIPATLVAHEGKLAAVPPDGYTFLALPFYLALGYRGLFLLQALAFLAAVGLCGHVARRLTGDREVALNAMLLLAFATFLWDYSQAAWPHALAACLVLAAFTATVHALQAGRARPDRDASRGHSLAWAATAGLLAGLAVSVRLDSVFVLPAVALPFLFSRPPRWRPLLAAGTGLAPPLLALAAANRVKFGVFSPFSYGLDKEAGEIGAYAAPVLAGAAVVLVAWLASRRGAGDLWRRRPDWLNPTMAGGLAAAATGAVVTAVPALRTFAIDAAAGAWQLVVDFRPRPQVWEPALGRTVDGGMVYIGGLKKSLLQSCPFLAALVIPIAHAAGGAGEERRRVLLLGLVPAAYLGFYGAFGWHGGLSLSLRYWTPALPFLAILAALAWKRMLRRGTPPTPLAAGTVALFLAAAFALDRMLPGVQRQQVLYLDLPLVLAGTLLLLLAADAALGRLARPRTAVARAAALTFLLAAAWGAFVTFQYDAPRHRAHRARNLALGEALRPVVPESALLLVNSPDPYYPLLEVPDLVLAVPPRDGFRDFRTVVDHHLDAGRPVVASFPAPVWAELDRKGHLEGYHGHPLTRGGVLVRLKRTEAGGTPPITGTEPGPSPAGPAAP